MVQTSSTKVDDDAICTHQSFTQEVVMGFKTGDYVCRQCGCIGSAKDFQPAKSITDMDHKYIREINQPLKGSHGYQFRFKNWSRWFATKKIGDKTKALLMAIAHRDKILKKLSSKGLI
jgi:transcription initiation factor TFIIIB Brf1 subunit/transcription initiation factor TFIIB